MAMTSWRRSISSMSTRIIIASTRISTCIMGIASPTASLIMQSKRSRIFILLHMRFHVDTYFGPASACIVHARLLPRQEAVQKAPLLRGVCVKHLNRCKTSNSLFVFILIGTSNLNFPSQFCRGPGTHDCLSWPTKTRHMGVKTYLHFLMSPSMACGQAKNRHVDGFLILNLYLNQLWVDELQSISELIPLQSYHLWAGVLFLVCTNDTFQVNNSKSFSKQVCVCVCALNEHTYIHTYVRTYIHTYMHACMHPCIHTYIYIYIIHIHIHLYIYIYILCVYIYIYYICIHSI